MLVEGAACRVSVNAYERDPEARQRCIGHYGTNCCICGFNSGAVYGELAEGYIHIHHLRLLSEIGGEYVVDPVEDLRPVCPNCHAVLHRRIPVLSLNEVRSLLRQQRRTYYCAAADTGPTMHSAGVGFRYRLSAAGLVAFGAF